MRAGSTLLDVNVLLALSWPNHLHHSAARRWFREVQASGWATCPLTESGFIRISSNPRVFRDAVSPAQAMASLRSWRSVSGHEFWTDATALCQLEERFRAPIVAHDQVTDAHLLSLARERGGRLASFDRGLERLLVAEDDPDLLILLPL